MKYFAMLSAVLALICPSAILAKPVAFVLKVHSPEFDANTTLTSKKNSVFKDQRLVAVNVSMLYAVQLDGDIPAEVRAKIGRRNTSLSSGSTLWSSADSQTLFCEVGGRSSWGYSGAGCLADTDGDNRFDTAYKTELSTWQPGGMVVSDKDPDDAMQSIDLGKPIVLTSPVPYHRVDNQAAPPAKGQIRWRAIADPDHPGPVRLQFWYEGTNDWSGGPLKGPGKEFDFTGAPVDVDLFGVHITVLGIAASGDLTYRLSGQIDDQAMKFYHRDFKITTIYY